MGKPEYAGQIFREHPRGRSELRRLALIALFCLPAAAADSALVIKSPADYQVFQRQTRDSGKVLVSGQAPADCDRVEAHLRGNDVAMALDHGAFRAELPAPAGGFYELTVAAFRGGSQIAERSIAHVGVGEVFVIAGQSNASNYGEERQRTRSGMVSTFSGTGWRPADDPQPGVQDNSSKGSFIPAFGDALYEKLRVPIGVACVGHGSTSVRQWLPKGARIEVQPTMPRFLIPVGPNLWESDGQLFDGLLRRIRELGTGGFRALLWHQGESDSHQKPGHDITGEEYERLLRQLIEASRREAGWSFPWFVAQVSYHTPDDPSCPPIREAQRRLWESGIALEGPDTDALTGDNRQDQGRGVHFSAKGLQAHGRLWAEKVGAWLESSAH